jgi:hypothetical protein
MVLTNPPFGKKSSITVINEEGDESKEALSMCVKGQPAILEDQQQLTGYHMIQSLKLRNFRCFKELDLTDLRRVNVVVGRMVRTPRGILRQLESLKDGDSLWRGRGTVVGRSLPQPRLRVREVERFRPSPCWHPGRKN